MFEDERNDQQTADQVTTNNSTGSSETLDLAKWAAENKPETKPETKPENSYSNYSYGQSTAGSTASGSSSVSSSAGTTTSAGTAYSQSRRPGYGQTTYGQSSYGQSQSSYGQSSYGQSSYGQGTGSSYSQSAGSAYSQGQFRSPSASASGSSYGQGTGSSYSSYGSGYSYGQSSYGQSSYGQSTGSSYSQNAQPSYGTYQYSTGNNSGNGGNVPPVTEGKKKHTAFKVIAAVVALALVVGAIGFGYNAVSRNLLAGKDDTNVTAQIEDKSEDTTTATDNTQSTTTTDKKISTTTVTGDSLAVVTDVTGVVAEVMPAMVMIHNNYTASASYFGYVTQEEATASGSGIIVGENDSELLIATNYHVIEGADTLEVIFSDDSTIEAVVKGTDSEMDLAVIAVMLEDIPSETKDIIKIATLGDSDALTLGEPAIAIGNALGYGQSVTTGVISALNREVEISEGGTKQTFIQTDAAINPGNSGGALLNIQGEVIGINSNKIGGETIEGMGYAIPISVAQPIIDKLMNEQTRLKVSAEDRGYIGISGVSVTAEVSEGYGIPQGVYVAEVSKGGGAESAGITKGDVITEFDGNEITSMDDLQTRLQYYAAGTTVQIKVMRQNGIEYVESTYDVTLGSATSVSGKGADSNAGQNGASGGYEGNGPH